MSQRGVRVVGENERAYQMKGGLMTKQILQSSEKTRIDFLDNLRMFIIFLVVCYHAGWVYESSGVLSWAWIVEDPSKNSVAGLLNLILHMSIKPRQLSDAKHRLHLHTQLKINAGEYRFVLLF